MSDLYIFSPDDKLLAILSNEAEGACAFWAAIFKEVLNQGSTFEFTCQGDHEDSQYIVAENQVAFKDKDGDFRLFIMRETEYIDGEDGPQIHVVCENAIWGELNDEIIEDKRPRNVTAKEALTIALSGTRVKAGNVADLGTNSTNFYYCTVTDGIENIVNTWGGELKDRITVDETGITGRYIDLLARRGQDIGKVWEMDKDIDSFTYQVQSYPKTALYGRGSSLETDDGGFTRKITFADVEWKVANGDPVDKPKGQEWVGDPDALQIYGRPLPDGSLRHRFGIFEDSEETDPAILLQKTWEALQQQKNPVVNFEMDVFLLGELIGYEHEKVRLGDTTFAVNRNFAKPITVEERVITFEYDVADPDNSGKVELGNFIDLFSDDERLDNIEAKLNDGAGIWNQAAEPITDARFPNVKPGTPTNVRATGLFENIVVEWDYDSSVYVANYEVYASQVEGFTPDASNLVWRGKASGYNHQAATNQQWYFRVRAVNTHGTASDFSNEVSAATVRIISDDILFGAINAQHIADLAITAEKLANGTIDLSKIGEDVKSEIDGAKEQAQTAVDTANQATQDAQEAISQAQQGFDAAQLALAAANSAMDTANNASQTASDAATQASSALTQAQNAMAEAQKKADASSVYTKTEIDDALEGYATTTTVNTLTGRVDSAETAIQQNTNAIQLKADKSTVDTLTGRVSTAEATLAAQADQIAARITKADADAKYATQTALTATANSLTSSITAVQTDLNNLQIGGRNLVLNSTFNTGDFTNWSKVNARFSVLPAEGDKPNSNIARVSASGLGTNTYASAYSNTYPATPGDKFTVSMDVKVTDFSAYDVQAPFIVEFYDESGNRVQYKDVYLSDCGVSPWSNGTWKRLSYTATVTNSSAVKAGVRLCLFRNGEVFYREIKMELGNRATDWTPAPEDMATVVQFNTLSQTLDSTISRIGDAEGNISALQQTASSLGTRITNAEGNISSLTQTLSGLQSQVMDNKNNISTLTQTATSLQSRMTTAEGNISLLSQTTNGLVSLVSQKADQSEVDSQISQLADDINLRVQKGEIINQINLSTEGILIDGKKIHITGQTTIDNAVIKSAMIADAAITQAKIANAAVGNAAIQNGSITNAKIATAAVGTAQIQDASITDAKIANISADKINAGAIRGIDIYGSKLRSSDGLTNLEIIGGNIRLTQSNGQYVNVNPAGLFGYNSSNVMTFRVDKTLVTSSALGTSVENVYLGAYGEARVVNYDDIPGDGLVGSYRYLPLRADGFYGNFLDITTGVNLYIRPYSNGEVRITNTGSTTSYRPLRASNLYADSVDVNSGTSIYLRPASNGSAHITATGTTNNYRPIYASEYRTGSSIEYKTNITELQRPALEIIRGLHVVEYDLKSDIENGEYNNRQIGLISEENPEVASPDGKAINIYKLTSLNTAGIQEHDFMITDLEDDVEWLKIENQYLKQKVSQLESRIQELEGKVA